MPGKPKEPDEPSYEQARAELREVVARLESGGQPLEESLALWERGEQLADICQRWLDDAGTRLDEAIARHDGPAGDASTEG
ncbi:exodeoxyribonuclease VII small subunit [uncultured Jatrophihabitans sp.]|uniref:exodeoxyribonuclease VII small subunit n=1 Tax=uncultured Jatrophihabitans sp. TaxID=1610747 RepID=UPI0035C9D72D